MSSIFKRASEGKTQTRTPFFATKGIFRVQFDAVRSGKNQDENDFVALDVSVLQSRLAGSELNADGTPVATAPSIGESRTIMTSFMPGPKTKDIFYNTLKTWGLQISRHFASQGGDDLPAESDVTEEVLENLFGAESALIGAELEVECQPRITKNGKTVYNFTFRSFADGTSL